MNPFVMVVMVSTAFGLIFIKPSVQNAAVGTLILIVLGLLLYIDHLSAKLERRPAHSRRRAVRKSSRRRR